MNPIGSITSMSSDQFVRELMGEVAAKRRKQSAAETISDIAHESQLQPPPKRLYDGPAPDGKGCAECHRPFKSSAEYVVCRACDATVCRRKSDCKRLHQAKHRAAYLNAKKQEAQ